MTDCEFVIEVAPRRMGPCPNEATAVARATCPKGHVREKYLCRLCRAALVARAVGCGACLDEGDDHSPVELEWIEDAQKVGSARTASPDDGRSA